MWLVRGRKILAVASGGGRLGVLQKIEEWGWCVVVRRIFDTGKKRNSLGGQCVIFFSFDNKCGKEPQSEKENVW